MHTPNHQLLLNTVSAIITGANPAIAIYCFGTRGTFLHDSALLNNTLKNHQCLHFDLLLLTKENKPNLCPDLAALVKLKTSGACTVAIVIHNPKSLQPKNPNRQNFFWQVMNHGRLIYKHPGTNAYTVKAEPIRDYHASARSWNTRYSHAKALLEAAPTLTAPEAMLVKFSLLNQAVSLTCLGLLEVFLGYRPNYFSIEFLFSLCTHFTRLPAEIFPNSSDEGRQMRQLLKLNPASLRHRSSASIHPHLLPELESRCNRFLTKANILAEVHLMPHVNL
ncbi:MAG TPA: hypothetical protein VGB43_07925 [Flavobacterium sp.]|jgi:hypothetical protein